MAGVRKLRTALIGAVCAVVMVVCSIVLVPAASASGRGDCDSNKACGWVDAYFGGSTTWTRSANGNYSLAGTSWDNTFSSVRSVHVGCAYYRDYSGGSTNIHLNQYYQITNLATDFPPLQDQISYVQLQGIAC